jgi:NitT/TauT family transport system ATP-binding protein
VGLKDFAHRYPIQLSGGMQRRAELARAIINAPRVMLMDEPFRGLDAITRQLMQEYVLRLFEESRGTSLFVTSELEEAIFLADRLIILTNRPTRVKKIMEIDLPRPRSYQVLTSSRYLALKDEALAVLHEEALQAFAAGAADASDLVEAYRRRTGRG